MSLTEESRYLSFSGLRVHFCVERPDVPVSSRLLLLSSPLTSTFHWRKLLPELDGLGCLTVLMDLPGFGRSDSDAPRSADKRAGLVWGVLDEVDRIFGAPLSLWHLGGHGLACATILGMTARCPDSVKSQILLSPLFSLGRRAASAGRWYDENVLNARHFHRVMDRWAGYPMDDYIVDRMRNPLLRRGMREAFTGTLHQAAASPKPGVLFCPTMALVGGRDPLMDDAALRQIRALLPEAELHRLPTAGHFPMETHSKALRDYLRGWLRYSE